MKPNCLHIWPRKDFMLIALPNLDRTFTLTLFLRHERLDGDEGVDDDCNFESLTTPDAVLKFFNREFSDVVPLIPNLVKV